MVVRFNSDQLVEVLSKKSLPVIGGDNDGAVRCSNKLARVDSRRRVDDIHEVSQPTHLGTSVSVSIVTCIQLCLDVLLQNLNIAYLFFRSPKHQSGENLVRPVIIKERVIVWCNPVSTRHSRYPTMMLFLF